MREFGFPAIRSTSPNALGEVCAMMSLENATQTGLCRSIHVVIAALLFLLEATSAGAQ